MFEKVIAAKVLETRTSSLKENNFEWKDKYLYNSMDIIAAGNYITKEDYEEGKKSPVGEASSEYVSCNPNSDNGVKVDCFIERPSIISKGDDAYYYPLTSTLRGYSISKSEDDPSEGIEFNVGNDFDVASKGFDFINPKFTYMGASPYIDCNGNILKYDEGKKNFLDNFKLFEFDPGISLSRISNYPEGYIGNFNSSPFLTKDNVSLIIPKDKGVVFTSRVNVKEEGNYCFSMYADSEDEVYVRGLNFVKLDSPSEFLKDYIPDETMETEPITGYGVEWPKEHPLKVTNNWGRFGGITYLHEGEYYAVFYIESSPKERQVKICGMSIEKSTYMLDRVEYYYDDKTDFEPIYHPILINLDDYIKKDKDWSVIYRKMICMPDPIVCSDNPPKFYDSIGDAYFGYYLNQMLGWDFDYNKKSTSEVNSGIFYENDWMIISLSHKAGEDFLSLVVMDEDAKTEFRGNVEITKYNSTIGNSKFNISLGGYFDNFDNYHIDGGTFSDLMFFKSFLSESEVKKKLSWLFRVSTNYGEDGVSLLSTNFIEENF